MAERTVQSQKAVTALLKYVGCRAETSLLDDDELLYLVCWQGQFCM